MRVGFDVTALLTGDTGVARYVRELGLALERLDVELCRFAIGRGNHAHALPHGTRRVRIPLRAVHGTWSLLNAPKARWLVPDCDVLHAPDLVPPPSATPQVVTVHDLVALAYPELHPPRAAAIQRRQLEVARDRAAVILAVSRSTADLLTARGVDPKKVVVTANGVSTLPPADCSLVPEDPYLLAVGTLTPRKGLETLIGAFATAVLPRGMRLVLAGTPGWQSTRVYEAIRANGVEGRVVCTGKVTDAQLAGLYRNCRAMCMPSLAEGFGLPILEAAAAGAPVIASDLAVFRELEECVALYAAPGDERDWITALEGIVADEDLRRAAVSRGREMARAYTWDRTAGAVLTAYQQAREAS